MDRTLFIDDAARLLGVSRRTVYYRITQGRLRTIRTRCGSRRVLLSSIEALLREEHEKRRTRTGGCDLTCSAPARPRSQDSKDGAPLP
jgi:excisionase family DNA binding protein